MVPDRRYSVEFYEGLVRKTSSMYCAYTEEEFEDVVQILRLKAWRALGTYDPSRSSMPVEKYVFMCVRNAVKDLLKRKHRNELYIEDQRGDGEFYTGPFDAHYLATTHDETYLEVERELPLVPTTLTDIERRVLVMLYASYSQREAALRLGVSHSEVERAVKGLRLKMADWKPSSLPVQIAA